MIVKRQLLCATALCGGLFAFAQPAWADCTVTAGSVVCTDPTTDGVVLADGATSFRNEGTITGASTTAVAGGTNIGDLTNAGTITVTSGGAHHGIDIVSMGPDAILTNQGLIQSGTGMSDAIRIGGAARVENQSIIEVRNGWGAAINVGGGSHIQNGAGAVIRSTNNDATAVRAGDDLTFTNHGSVVQVGNAIDAGDRATITNHGMIETRYSSIQAGSDSRVTNALGGVIKAEYSDAVRLGANSVFTNAGHVETADASSDGDVAIQAFDSIITNEATGTINRAVAPGGRPVIAISGSNISLRNAGRIHGNVEGVTEVLNGVTASGTLAAGPSQIDGDISATSGDDRVQNAGTINGDISLGAGSDLLLNEFGGVIIGNIDLGTNEIYEIPANNTFANGGTVTGDILGGQGEDEIDSWGVINGDIDLGGEDDLLKFSGTLNGNVRMGAGDDEVIVFDRPALGAGGRIDAEGGARDHLIFNGDGGTWYASQFGNFEKLTKLGTGRTVLKDTWWGFAEVSVTDGVLVVDSGDDDGLAGAITVSSRGVYQLNGVHYGDIQVEDGGTLAGTGRNSAQGVTAVHVNNVSGVVAPGDAGIGVLTLTNDYHQGALGRLDIELGAPGQADRLVVGGTAYLDGEVRFVPLDLAETGPYVFMEYNAVSGQFANIASAAGLPGLFFSYTIDYQAGQAVVNVVKTGATTGEPDPEPVPGCTPSSAPSGSTVICVPTITAPQVFTTQDLDIHVNGVLTYASASPIIRTTGSNINLTVSPDAGIINDAADSSAVVMEGETNHLINHGVIRSGVADNGSGSRIVSIASALGKTSTVENGVNGVIGHAGVDTVIAIDAAGGAFEIENAGRIYGVIQVDGESARIANGRHDENGALQGPGIIEGSIFTTAGDDQILNRGYINGAIVTYAGADRIVNHAGATIIGEILTYEGDDNIILDGLVRGAVEMGDGADILEIYGSLDGDALMGDGDDQVRIANTAQPDAPAALTAGHTISGGAGWDRLIFAGSTGSWDAAQFSGFELLRKEGSGTTTLTGVWDDLDPTTSVEVASGVLRLAQGAEMHHGVSVKNTGHYRIDGAHLADVSVNLDGMVSGAGAIGSSTLFTAGQLKSLTNGGVVAPGGDSLGVLTVWGDYHQGSAGRLDIQLGPNGQSDLLDVKGQAFLNGAVQFIPLDAGVTGPYTFLKAGGGVTGTFGTLNPDPAQAQEGLLFTYLLDYSTSGQVSVNVTRTGEGPIDPTDPTDPIDPVDPEPNVLDVIAGLTANQSAVREAFLSDGVFSSDLARVRADLNGISLDKAAHALDSFSGELYASAPNLAARATQRFTRAVEDRMGHERLDVREAAPDHGATVWTELLATSSHQQGGRAHSGYDLDMIGSAIGADARFGPGLRAGVAIGRTDADIDQPHLEATAQITTDHIGAYASADLGAAFLDAQAGYAWHEVAARRTLVTGDDTSRRSRGETKAEELHATIRAGFTLQALAATWRPYGALSYAHVEQDGFVETGAGDAGLTVGAADHEAFTATLGLDASWLVGSLRPYAGVAFSRELDSDGPQIRSRLIGGGDPFGVRGAGAGDSAALGRFGLGGQLGPVEVSVGYDVEVRDRYLGHALTAGARLRW